jgi:hypothetical protein
MALVTQMDEEQYVPDATRTRPVTGCYNYDLSRFRIFSRASGATPGSGKKQVLEFDEQHARELHRRLGEFLEQHQSR